MGGTVRRCPKASALQACSPVLHTGPCCIQLKGNLQQLMVLPASTARQALHCLQVIFCIVAGWPRDTVIPGSGTVTDSGALACYGRVLMHGA